MALLALLWVPTAARRPDKGVCRLLLSGSPPSLPLVPVFKPDHKFVGIPLFFSLAVVVLEGPAAFITAKIAAKYPQFVHSGRPALTNRRFENPAGSRRIYWYGEPAGHFLAAAVWRVDVMITRPTFK